MPRGKEPQALRNIRESDFTDNAYMTAEIPVRLLRNPDVTPRGKIIYLALRHNAAERGDLLIASGDQRHFAEDAGLTLKTFANGLPELERHQWVAILRPNEEEKTVTINGLETTFRVKRNPGDYQRVIWGNVYFLLENFVGSPMRVPPVEPDMTR